jgi:hypothetical protein
VDADVYNPWFLLTTASSGKLCTSRVRLHPPGGCTTQDTFCGGKTVKAALAVHFHLFLYTDWVWSRIILVLGLHVWRRDTRYAMRRGCRVPARACMSMHTGSASKRRARCAPRHCSDWRTSQLRRWCPYAVGERWSGRLPMRQVQSLPEFLDAHVLVAVLLHHLWRFRAAIQRHVSLQA